MGLFSKKKNSFLGIDFGTSTIKVVELSYKDQKAHLENYAIADLGMLGVEGERQDKKEQSYEQKLNECFTNLMKRMDTKAKGAQVSIPGFSGLVTLIDLPDMGEEDLANAIQFEAHKYIPTSLDDVAMSWEVVEKSEGAILEEEAQAGHATKRIKVLLVAAPKREIERYERLVKGIDIDVNAIELETFSIARSLVGDDEGNFIIIDMGAHATNIILVEKSVVRVNRSIDAGGNEITNAIIDSMNISKQRADIFKKGEKDLINSKESSIIIPVLELVVGETQRIMASYQQRNKGSRIDGVIISGGSARMKGMEEYFSRQLGTKAALGNPWRRVVVEEPVQKFVEELGTSFSVAIGLALRGIEEYKRK
jgi:type IV pilus assembly protein PilM